MLAFTLPPNSLAHTIPQALAPKYRLIQPISPNSPLVYSNISSASRYQIYSEMQSPYHDSQSPCSVGKDRLTWKYKLGSFVPHSVSQWQREPRMEGGCLLAPSLLLVSFCLLGKLFQLTSSKTETGTTFPKKS